MATNIKSIIEPPRWQTDTNTSKSQEVEAYIRDPNVFKELQLFTKDNEIIFFSLNKSNKLDIYNELSKEEREDFTKYKAYLKSNYGGTYEQLKSELNEMRQTLSEIEQSFFYIIW